MIKIMTKDGISLDLAPDAEFVIEYNNPMMEDDRIPVPFSTSIALLPSATNCKVLQYLPALKLEPVVKKLAASLVFNGIPFLTGTLIYDGIEDGNLNYTFSGRDIENDWGMKIYEFTGAKYVAGVDKDGVAFPPVVLKDYTGYFVEELDDLSTLLEDDRKYPKVEARIKYGNFPLTKGLDAETYKRTVPAISAEKIIGEHLLFSTDILQLYPFIYILAQYCLDDTISDNEADAFRNLPDITLVEFVQELAKMFCAAVFDCGDRFEMMSFESVSKRNAEMDWTGKVSDTFSGSFDVASGYLFAYGNAEEDAFDSSEVVDVPNLAAAIFPYGMEYNYTNKGVSDWERTVRIKSTGDCLSVYCRAPQGSMVYGGVYKNFLTVVLSGDIVFHNNLKVGQDVDAEEVEEVSCGFNLVKSLPMVFTSHYDDDKSHSGSRIVCNLEQKVITTPIVETVGGTDSARGTDIYIGLLNKGGLSGDGRYVDLPVRWYLPEVEPYHLFPDDATIDTFADKTLIPEGSTEPISLRPGWLYEHFHKRYAQWLSADRQVISCDVNLNEFDLVNFRMYKKVRLHGRDFFVKKLSVTLRAGSETMECSADFISA